MLVYLLLFGAGIMIGFLFFFVNRSIARQQLSAANDQLRLERQAFSILQAEKSALQKEKEELLARAIQAEGINTFLQEAYTQYHQLQRDHQDVQGRYAAMQTQLKAAYDKLTGQKEELESMNEKFRFEFNNLAQGILEEKTARYTQVNEEKMKAILDPLKAQLIDFKTKVEETYDKESRERFTLSKEVQRLVEMSRQVSEEANNLAAALKGNNKQQGNWGEMILESILSNSGLTKGREYLVQESIRDNAGNMIKDENGRGLQPDIILIYPDQRKIIIDAKVSLIAWDRYVSEEDVTVQKGFLKDHVQSIRAHIDGLSKKNYSQYAQALDYVLLFIPIEPAYLEALRTDLQLWKYAYDKRVMLVSATNLLAILRIIADLWRVEQQNLHATEIADKAGALYDKFVSFILNLEQVGKKIEEAQQSYDTAFRQLSTGRGNIIAKVEELRSIGANTHKQLPDKILSPLKAEDRSQGF